MVCFFEKKKKKLKIKKKEIGRQSTKTHKFFELGTLDRQTYKIENPDTWLKFLICMNIFCLDFKFLYTNSLCSFSKQNFLFNNENIEEVTN